MCYLVAFPLLKRQFFYPHVQIMHWETSDFLLYPMSLPWLKSVFVTVLLLSIATYPDCRICAVCQLCPYQMSESRLAQCLRRTISTRIPTCCRVQRLAQCAGRNLSTRIPTYCRVQSKHQCRSCWYVCPISYTFFTYACPLPF